MYLNFIKITHIHTNNFSNQIKIYILHIYVIYTHIHIYYIKNNN